MDLRVFGSTYPYSASIPYASGFGLKPVGSGMATVKFSSCRALYIEAKSGGGGGFLSVELTDAPGQYARVEHINGDQIFPISCTAVHSGDVNGVFVLY